MALDDKRVEELIKKLEGMDPENQDLVSSKEFKELRDELHERHDAADDKLKDSVENTAMNKVLNAAQIVEAVEGRDRAKRQLSMDKKQEDSMKRQRKHNKGARDAREEIISQNREILRVLGDLRQGMATSNKQQIEQSKLQTDVSKKTAETVKETAKGVDARNIKQEGLQFRNTETGQYTQSPVEALAGDIKASQGLVGTTRDRHQFAASKASASLSKSMTDNAGQVQTLTDNNEEAKLELTNLAKLLQDYETGNKKGKEASKKREAIHSAFAKTKAVGGDELSQALGLDAAQKEFKGGGSKIKSFMGLNQGTSLRDEEGNLSAGSAWEGVKQGVGEVFSADRIFGEDKGWIFNKSAQWGSQRRGDEAGKRQIEKRRQGAAIGNIMGEDGLGLARPMEGGESNEAKRARMGFDYDKDAGFGKKAKDLTESDIAEMEARRVSGAPSIAGDNLEQATQEQQQEQQQADAPTKREKMVSKRTGQSTESVAQKQLETLEEIRDILQNTASMMEEGGGGSGGFGLMDAAMMSQMNKKGDKKPGKKPGNKKPKGRLARMFSAGKNVVSKGAQLATRGGAAVVQGARTAAPVVQQGAKTAAQTTARVASAGGRGIMSGAAKIGGRALGAVGGVALGAYEAVTGFNEAEAQADNLEINAEEEQAAKGEAIGEGAGGAAGAIGGAAAGAAIGSVVPVVGTVIGGIIGGAIGYFGGSWLGGKAGKEIADAIPVNEELLKESNEHVKAKIEEVGEIDPVLGNKIISDAKDIEAQMLEDAGDEVSDNDKAAIQNAAYIQSLKENDADIQWAMANPPRSSSSMSREAYNIKKGLRDDRDAMDMVAKDMGIDNEGGNTAEIKDGKIVKVNGQDVPAELQRDTDGNLVMGVQPGGPSPTGQAIENMNELVSTSDAMGPPKPVVVANQPAPAPAPPSEPNIAIARAGIRKAHSTLERFYDNRIA